MDRNPIDVLAVSALPESLSARRAWIEISVRFNAIVQSFRRSPQGERG